MLSINYLYTYILTIHQYHDFYIVVGKQCRTENMYDVVTNTISLYKLTNVLISFICFKLVLSF